MHTLDVGDIVWHNIRDTCRTVCCLIGYVQLVTGCVFFFPGRGRQTRLALVSWAGRCVYGTGRGVGPAGNDSQYLESREVDVRIRLIVAVDIPILSALVSIVWNM